VAARNALRVGMTRSESAGSLTTVAFFPAVASASSRFSSWSSPGDSSCIVHGPARSTLLLPGAERRGESSPEAV
jgi:hypothetical protein